MANIFSKSQVFIKRNGSTILTVLGGVGVVATSVLAVKATPKALYLLKQAEEEKGEELTTFETIKVAGPTYIPTIMTGVTTIACIFGIDVLGKRQQASLASAYALLDTSYKEYKAKVKKMLGEETDKAIKTEIAKDKYDGKDISISEGKELFYDSFSGRYFESTKYKVQEAEYYLNRDLIMRDYATINEFYDYLDIPHIEGGDDLGWSTAMNFEAYWQIWIDFGHHKAVMDDGLECTIITIFAEPTLDWNDYA